MPIPIVTQPDTPRSLVVGVAIAPLSLSATGLPDYFTATPLPTGLTLDAASGVISGTPTAGGVVTTSITAINSDGTSPAISVVWSNASSPVGGGAWSDTEIDFDLITRQVTQSGVAIGADGAAFRAAKGDNFDLLIGFSKYGVFYDLGSSVTVRIGFKEFEAEALKELAGGVATEVQTGSLPDTTRYRITLPITAENWALLADYEEEDRTSIVAPVQIEVHSGGVRFCSDTFGVEVIRDSVPD